MPEELVAASASLTVAETKPIPQFCDRDGARGADGNPIGCGARLPDGSYTDSWVELSDPDDQSSAQLRKHGRFIVGGHECERCSTMYHSSIAERMQASATA